MSVRTLTNRHRAQQLVLSKATRDVVTTLWPAIKWQSLDETYPALEARVALVVARNHRDSAVLAGAYLKAARSAAGVRGAQIVSYAEAIPIEQLSASLQATSIAALKTASGNGIEPAIALRTALTLTQGSMSRLVLSGGRQTVTQTTTADPRIVGWQRVGVGKCDFCQMLLGRGAVYSEESSSFEAHDHCGCSAEPVYTN